MEMSIIYRFIYSEQHANINGNVNFPANVDEMLKIYQFVVSEQHVNVDVNVSVMEHANINGNVNIYINSSFPLVNFI
jgi:acyl-[acyl carrier protein]--UDP-N-acetylglucosamine O-acyltransferase